MDSLPNNPIPQTDVFQLPSPKMSSQTLCIPDSQSPRKASGASEENDCDSNLIQDLSKALGLIKRVDAKHEIAFASKDQSEEIALKQLKLANALKSLQIHLNFVLEILLSESDEDIPDIISRYKPINRYYKSITSKENICQFLVQETMKKVVFMMIKEAEKVTDNFFVLQSDGSIVISTDPEAFDNLQIVTSKLETLVEYFPDAATMNSDDILAQKRTSEMWKILGTRVESVVLADKDVLKNRWKKMKMMLTILNAMIYKNQYIDAKTIKDKLKGTFSAVYFGAKMKEAEMKASLYLSNPKMDSAFQVWNFAENGIVKELMKFTLPTIDYDRKLYVHRLFPSINKETILKEYEDGTLNTIIRNEFKPINLTAKKDLILESIFQKQADAVAIRLIAPFPLVVKGINSEKARAMAMKAMNRFNQFIKQGKGQATDSSEGIIIHIHGGGFVSGSSSTHRNYLYRWAKSLNKIIFSIDYRLAPDYPYPAGLDDVWQAYNWIINYAEPLLGIKTNKIILAGDSAGGNLVMALTLRAIKMGVRIPDGCFLAYPALNMCPKQFSPSYFYALDDMILPYSLLKLCIKAYIPEEFKPLSDPFLSPVVASDEMLEMLPPIRILTGSIDPLHDDSWRFLHRLQKFEKDVKMIVFENMPHGFMSFDQIEEYKVIVDGTCKIIENLFQAKMISRRKTLRLTTNERESVNGSLSF